MKDNVLIEVSEILNAFNISEIAKLVEEQIKSDYTDDDSTETIVDHLKPLYFKYKDLTRTQSDEDILNEAKLRFYDVCKVFINAIIKRFNLEIDNEWIDDNYNKLPGITFAMYSFFVLDFSSNMYEVLLNYIMKNSEEIYKTFEDLKNKKDSSTLVNKKNMSPEMALIISNIYNISSWVFDIMTEDEFFSYLDSDYAPLKIIRALFNEGKICGEFMNAINAIYQTNIQLKSTICFNIIYRFKNGELKDPNFKSSDK